jgi:hypothetical protein
MIQRVLVTAVLSAFLALPSAWAQPPGPSGDAQVREEKPAPESEEDVRELVESIRMAKLSREVGLTEEQTVLLMRRYHETRNLVGRLTKKRAEQLKDLREAVAGEASDDLLMPLLEQIRATDMELMRIHKEAVAQASEGLTVTQQAKLYVFMNTFDHDMRRLVERVRRSRSGEGRPAPGAQHWTDRVVRPRPESDPETSPENTDASPRTSPGQPPQEPGPAESDTPASKPAS